MDIAMNLEHLGNGTIAVTGALKTVVRSEEDGPFPHMVLEMTSQSNETVKLRFEEGNISTIVQLANESKLEKLRDAARWPKP